MSLDYLLLALNARNMWDKNYYIIHVALRQKRHIQSLGILLLSTIFIFLKIPIFFFKIVLLD